MLSLRPNASGGSCCLDSQSLHSVVDGGKTTFEVVSQSSHRFFHRFCMSVDAFTTLCQRLVPALLSFIQLLDLLTYHPIVCPDRIRLEACGVGLGTKAGKFLRRLTHDALDDSDCFLSDRAPGGLRGLRCNSRSVLSRDSWSMSNSCHYMREILHVMKKFFGRSIFDDTLLVDHIVLVKVPTDHD